MDITILYLTENVNIQNLLFGLVILLIIPWLVARSKHNNNLPPGPIAFPIIGNLLQIISSTDLYLKMEDLRKQYGDIFRLKVGSDTFVFVCKTELILEGLVKKGDQLKGICNWVYIFDKVFQRKGVSFNSGKEWKDLRRFITSTFRDLGVGKRNTEKKIYLETLTLGEVFESHNGKPFSLSNPMSYYSLIIIYSIIFGERLAFGSPEIVEILENFKFFFKHVNAVVPENFFPFIRFLRWNSPIQHVIKKREELRSYVKNKIQEHKETFNAEDIRDFIDMYLLTLEKEPNNESLSDANMLQTIVDIFAAGTDTIGTLLLWAFLFMAKYPDIQNKCREEIKQITNLNRPVTMEDKPHMTYVAATLLEIHRIATVSPISPPHAAEVDTTLGGYDIPKNTVVSYMLKNAHFDPKYWDDPKEFRPERWIGKNNELKKNEAFMPFSLGPRVCPALPLANTETFITFANILQKFQLDKPDENPMTIEGRQSGITYVPVNDNIRAIHL